MQMETGSPASRAARLTFAEAWQLISQQLAAEGHRKPTINAYAHVWAHLGRQAAQSTGVAWSEAEVPLDPVAITRLLAAMATTPDGRPIRPSTRLQQRYIVRACYRRLREAEPGPQGGSIDAE